MIKNMSKILIIIMGALILGSDGFTLEERAGTTSCEFLKINMSARLIGLGESYTAMSEDINSMYCNPAGLGYLLEPEVTLSHNSWFDDISIQSVGYIHPLKGSLQGTLGIGLLYLHMGELPGYDIDSFGNPERESNFNVCDILGTVSYSRYFKGDISIGMNVKIFQESLADRSVNSFILDLGGLYRTELFGNKTNLGVVIQNIGQEIKFIEESYPLPTNLKIGVSMHLLDDKLLVNTDVNKPHNMDLQPSIGFEYSLSDIVSFRAGYNSANKDNIGVNLGLGIKMDRWVLDYAYVPYGKLGDAHRISLSARFGDVSPAKSSSELLYEKIRLQNKQKELDRIMVELQKERQALNKKRVTVKKKKPDKKEQAKIIKNLQKEHEINVRKKKNKMTIALSGTIFGFKLGSHEIEQDYRDKLHEIAGLIKSVPGCKVEIVGHADDSGDSKDNYELSLKRAKSVLNYFVKIEKIPQSEFTAIGYGSTKPLVTDGNDIVEQRIRNRRVEIVITK